MAKCIKYLFILILITGCNPSVNLHSNFVVDSSFTAEQQNEIVESVSEWESVTDGMIKLNLVFSNQPEMYGNDYNKILNIIDESNYLNTDALGKTNVVASVIRILILSNRIERSQFLFKEVVLHELGHSFGLPHQKSGLMNPSVHGQTCIDNSTLDEFCNLHNCNDYEIKSSCINY